MLFNQYLKEGTEAETNDIDLIAGNADPDTEDGMDAIAKEVENNMMTSALESMTYFDNGEEVQKSFTESAEVQAMVEAQKMSKKTFVRIGKNDDLTRREHLAALILCRNAKDPLFKQLALNRVKERKLRLAIFTKYGTKAKTIAKRSQKEHIKNAKKLPPIRFM